MGRSSLFAVLAVVGLLGASLPLSAQDANADLKKEVDELRDEVRSLRKSTEAPTATPVSVDPVAPPVMTLDGESPLLTALKESKISGFVDVGFMVNLNNPANDSNVTRGFDTQDHGFLMHHAQLMLERVATKDVVAGYRIRLAIGEDAETMGVLFGNTSQLALEEGYVQILANVGNGIDIKVGRFVTLAGYEVIESKDNMNYSRSNAFVWAIPLAHTGIRGAYAFSDQVKVTLGVINGWDDYDDVNDQMSLEFQLMVVPVQNISLYANVYWGAERAATGATPEPGNDKRFLLDFVGVATFDKLTIGVNVDVGQEDFEATGLFPSGDNDDSWFGWAVYGKYQVNDQWAIAARVDGFSNENASRGINAITLDPTATDVDPGLLSVTLTLEHRPVSSLILRIEVRIDTADADIYQDRDGLGEDSQTTLGFEAIFVY